MRIVLLPEIPDDTTLRREWNGLVERVEQPQVFFTYEWALAVQRAYSATLLPLIVLAYDEHESLIGIAALASDARKTKISFLCATTGDYCDFLSLPEHKPALVNAVLGELSKQAFRNVVLTNLPADSASVAALRAAARGADYCLYVRTAYLCAQVSLAELERRPGENKPVLPRKKMLRRFLNAMGREAPVRLDHARSWGDIAPILPQFRQSHIARFLATGRISNLARPERLLFLEELAKLLGERGWLALTRMMSGSHTFAWNYGFQFRDTWFWYQPTFDSDLEKYSPGFCLLAKLIEEAADSPDMKIVDLGLGAEEYKERFANRSRETVCVTLRASAKEHVREIVRYRAAEVVRKSSRAEAVMRALAARAADLRARIVNKGVAATASWMISQIGQRVFSETEVFFYEWRGSAQSDIVGCDLCSLDLNDLASAVIDYIEDPPTLAHLLRSVARLGEGNAEGFALHDSAGKIVHFAWAAPFDGFFLDELNAPVRAPSPDCVMLFDCWTPGSERGQGYYGQAIERVARRMEGRGKRPWIFSAANNLSSVSGLRKSGFHRQYSMVRRNLFGWQKISGETPQSPRPQPAEVSDRV